LSVAPLGGGAPPPPGGGPRALGDVGGSPLVQVNGRTFFGPVLTAVPEHDSATALFDAVAALALVPEFAQLQRPRPAH
ncbi:hypothetical protein P5V45_02105, partial [Mycobacteroides abscessus subsp. massiliense]|nr:hypothetical protein [Mycobacteroides abscessus subsp. massiliense]